MLANGVLAEVDLIGQALMGSPVRLPALGTGMKPSQKEAGAYLGRYRLAPQVMLDVTLDDGQLFVQLSGQQKFKLLVLGEDHFRTETVPAELMFSRKKSRVTHVTLLQGGRETKAKRIGDVPIRVKQHLSAEQLEPYVGSYSLQSGLNLTVTRQGTALWVQASGQQNFPVFAETETRFFYEVVAADIEFNVKGGEVKGLWLHQNGKHYGKKID